MKLYSRGVDVEIKARAEVYYGDEICKEKCKELLNIVELPTGLLPLEDIDECGYVKETGFFWFKRKYKKEYKFESIGRLVSYAPEVTGYIEKKRIKKATGIKSKELLIWITITELMVDDNPPPSGKITFKTPAGLFRSFPVSAFEIQEVN
ncbi:Protein of unknown function DUF538 [Macleaya cordata]|uniref:DUF538 domain-containing protein n=1 Tax=Macleaya cordata TaxID=56857 RepID=A0A200QT11_MACCD|nr:Protein of unknown function DUF538 [Macleaya cordata]